MKNRSERTIAGVVRHLLHLYEGRDTGGTQVGVGWLRVVGTGRGRDCMIDKIPLCVQCVDCDLVFDATYLPRFIIHLWAHVQQFQ